MIERLLELPAHVRKRLERALEAGVVAPPYTEPAVRSALSWHEGTADLCAALRALEARGIPARAVALSLALAEQTAARIDRPDLVWSGPEVPGLHARDTRRVYEELVAAAQRFIWLSTYAYYDGPRTFKTLAQRMDATPDLQVTMLLNIQRKHGDTTASDELVNRFADRFWNKDWPGKRHPNVFYDPRSLDPDGAEGVLHAKAVVVDDERAFITSANLTEAAFDRNIEVGLLSRDHAVAANLSRHFRVLIEQTHVRPLPIG